MPVISVIVPVYKVEPYLHRCVDSILGQTFTDFELILVDDGSPDNCGSICDEYAVKDSRVVVIHQENGGLSAARNAGIDWAFANSDSQWLSFIDSDDWVHPEYLQRLFNIAKAQDADMVFCTLTAFTEDNDGYKEIEFWGKPSCEARKGVKILQEATRTRNGKLSGHHVIACNKLYAKKIFTDLRYPAGQVHEDEATAHRVLGACKKVVGVADSLYFYRQNPSSIMKAQNGLYRDLCITLAYGDRIQYYHQKQLEIADALLHQYWAILMRNYFLFPNEEKCAKLIGKTVRQMRGVYNIYKNTNASAARKFGIGLFCRMPKLISRLFFLSVKMRGG